MLDRMFQSCLVYLHAILNINAKTLICYYLNSLFVPISNTLFNFSLRIFNRILKKYQRVQQIATKPLPFVPNKPYKDRLSNLEFYLLVTKRLKKQLIEVYKILNGFNIWRFEYFLS